MPHIPSEDFQQRPDPRIPIVAQMAAIILGQNPTIADHLREPTLDGAALTAWRLYEKVVHLSNER